MFASLSRSKSTIDFANKLKIHRIKFPITFTSADEMLCSHLAVFYSDSDTLSNRLKILSIKQIKKFVVFGLKDALIRPHKFRLLCEHMDLYEPDFYYFDENGKLEEQLRKPSDGLGVAFVFRDGGHFAYNKYSDIVHNQINRLIGP